MMLGIIPDAEYGTVQNRLAPGAHPVLYTDGVTEGVKPNGTILEDGGLVYVPRAIAGGGPADIYAYV
jgi:serine phosphatase RsbU (regulator of sigma subunit)